MDKPSLQISITPGTILATVAIVLGVWLLFVLKALVLIVVTAVVIASAVEPGIRWLIDRSLSRTFAVSLTYLLVLVIVFIPLYFFLPPLLDEAVGFVSMLSERVQTVDIASIFPTDVINSTRSVVSSGSLTSAVLDFRQFFSSAPSGFLHAVSSVFGGVSSFFLIIILSIYFALNETGIDDFLRIVVPAKHRDYALSLWHRSRVKIGLWMQGQIVLSLIIGLLGYLWLAILQVPYAFLIAVFAAGIEIIPIFGSFISGILAVAVAASAGGPTLALLVAGGFLVINLLQSHLIYPLVVKQIVGVPPLLVILAMIAGAQLAGFLGILLAVPAAAALKEFVSDLEKRKDKELARAK